MTDWNAETAREMMMSNYRGSRRRPRRANHSFIVNHHDPCKAMSGHIPPPLALTPAQDVLSTPELVEMIVDFFDREVEGGRKEVGALATVNGMFFEGVKRARWRYLPSTVPFQNLLPACPPSHEMEKKMVGRSSHFLHSRAILTIGWA